MNLADYFEEYKLNAENIYKFEKMKMTTLNPIHRAQDLKISLATS